LKPVFISAKNFLFLFCFFISILNTSNGLTFAQDSKKIEELTRKLENLNKQIEACGDDIGCIQGKMNQIQQVSNEIQKFQNELQKDPSSIEEELINTVPKESQFPPPFDKITEEWLRHTFSASRVLRFDCNKINSTRENVLDKIDKIYKKDKGLTGPPFPLPLVYCEETTVTLKERGKLNEPDQYYLEYEVEFTDNAAWTSDYILLIGDKYLDYEEKLSYKLGLAHPHNRNAKVINYTGWIMDNSKKPPLKLPINRYKILEQDIIDIGVQVPSYKGYTLIFPDNIIEDKKNKHKLGEVKSYRMVLPHQIVRFYSDLNPELFLENTELVADLNSTIDEQFSAEEVQMIFQKGEFAKIYSTKGITQELEIGIPSLGCNEQLSSSKGAIILSGDCIDHGGYVIATDKSTIVNGRPVAKVGDKVICFKHGETEIVLTENINVTSNKKRIARIGDKTKCGAKLLGGSRNTFAGNK
jgi:uncharacterized Zn-binding protein involved in type VI secretion